MAWGPACRMKVDQSAANCHTTQLESTPGTNFSCGVVGLRTNGSSRIWAKPVSRYVQITNSYIPANKYRWHCVNVGENTSFDILTPSYPMLIYPQYGFALGATYSVTVQASFDNGATYCPVGPSCQISFAATNTRIAEEPISSTGGELLLWPNPNRGDQFNLRITDLESTNNEATLEVVNMFGERVITKTLVVSDGLISTTVDLDRTLASGLYLVNLTAGGKTTTKRLVIQR